MPFPNQSRVLIGIDVGGTFTDVVAYDQRSGALRAAKVPTDAEVQSEGVFAGIRHLVTDDMTVFGIVHGTTVATNALLEGRSSLIALVTTAGFRDVLEIARYARESLYELERPGRPPPVVPRHLRLEVAERTLHDGSILEPLSGDEIAKVVERIRKLGVEAVAICLLHSYANTSHERLLKAAIESVVPYVCASSEVNAEFREYERTSTTALNAWLMPAVVRYLEQLEKGLTREGISAPLHLVQANGGMMSLETAARLPIRLLMSGPAAGVAAAQYLLRRLGIGEAVTFDMGGTSTDVCLITGGTLETVRERRLSGWRKIRMPSVAVESIGAGGGSIAWLDQAGALHVGPQSAGARPGPAAYGLGGEQPTVTDANVALGLIRDGVVLGEGTIRIDRSRALHVLGKLGEALGLDAVRTATGVVEVANANMLGALRLVTVQRGIDPRNLALVAYGGAGPLHATYLASRLGAPRVVVPALAGEFAAFGCLVSEPRYDIVQTYLRPLIALTAEELERRFAALEEAACRSFLHEGYSRQQIAIRRSMDLRYAGQNYELEVLLDPTPGGLNPEAIRTQFAEQHRRLYSYATDEPAECVTLRVAALVSRAILDTPTVTPEGPALLSDAYPCVMPGAGDVTASVYRRSGLTIEASVAGPALIEDEDSTTVVLPGQTAYRDSYSNLLVEVDLM